MPSTTSATAKWSGSHWPRARCSIQITRYGSYETRATGMLFVCSEEKRIEVAQYIIRQTMWHRKQLLKGDRIERDKPTRWSRSPIRMKANYEHVYLTTYQKLRQGIMRIYEEDKTSRLFCVDAEREHDSTVGDYVDWPYRYFCNPACDLLKFVNFFSLIKEKIALHKSMPHVSREPYYSICIRPEDRPIVEMYPDVMEMEDLEVYEYPD